MILEIVFVVLFILWVLGYCAPQARTPGSPFYYGHGLMLAILIGILGWCLFNNVR